MWFKISKTCLHYIKTHFLCSFGTGCRLIPNVLSGRTWNSLSLPPTRFSIRFLSATETLRMSTFILLTYDCLYYSHLSLSLRIFITRWTHLGYVVFLRLIFRFTFVNNDNFVRNILTSFLQHFKFLLQCINAN